MAGTATRKLPLLSARHGHRVCVRETVVVVYYANDYGLSSMTEFVRVCSGRVSVSERNIIRNALRLFRLTIKRRQIVTGVLVITASDVGEENSSLKNRTATDVYVLLSTCRSRLHCVQCEWVSNT